MHHCQAVFRRLKVCVCVCVWLSFALCPQNPQLVQHISVLGGSSKCSKSSIVQFQCTGLIQYFVTISIYVFKSSTQTQTQRELE